jgi:transposase
MNWSDSIIPSNIPVGGIASSIARRRWPPISDGVMRLTASQLAALVDGMDWSRLHARDITQPTATS